MLSRQPVFTLVVAITLALGIGANAAVFSVVDVLLFRSLPVKDPNRLVVAQRILSDGRIKSDFNYAAFEKLRDLNGSLSGVFAYFRGRVPATVDGNPELLSADFVSGDYFDILGVSPARGHFFRSDNDGGSEAAAAVISFGYWQRRFGKDPAAVGKTIEVGEIPIVIAGVSPEGFTGTQVGGEPRDVVMPLAMQSRLASRGALRKADETQGGLLDPGTLGIMARLKPGASSQQASVDLDLIYQQSLKESLGSVAAQRSPRASEQRIDLKSGARGDTELDRSAALELSILAAVVGIILFIASVNVANLLLARMTVRQKEIAARLALGATRGRLIRQLLTESVFLAMLGAGLGLVCMKWSVGALLRVLPFGPKTGAIDFPADTRVLAFTAAVTLLVGVLFGLAPALTATRGNLASILKAGEYSRGTRLSGRRLMPSLVVWQVALSLALLIGVGLLMRSLFQLYHADMGFERSRVLTISAYPALAGRDRAREIGLYQRTLEGISAIPGVKCASLTLAPLYGGSGGVGPRFFETEGIRLLEGREFTDADAEAAPKVAVISDSMAQQFFPSEYRVGQHFDWELGGGYAIQRVPSGGMEIVGVAKDIRIGLRQEEWLSGFYIPYTQAPPPLLGQVEFLVRTTGDPTSVRPAVNEYLRSINRDLVIVGIKTQAEEMNERYLGGEQSLAQLLTSFTGIAVCLAAVGLYGTISYSVGKRTREFGIRMALGAPRGQMLWMVLAETLTLVGIGIVIGTPLAMAATRLASSMIFGVTAADLLSISGAAAVMLIIGFLAGYIPARRAMNVDPAVALRFE
jgi:ABC-type antimicrobial peptide transport system permease subunit